MPSCNVSVVCTHPNIYNYLFGFSHIQSYVIIHFDLCARSTLVIGKNPILTSQSHVHSLIRRRQLSSQTKISHTTTGQHMRACVRVGICVRCVGRLNFLSLACIFRIFISTDDLDDDADCAEYRSCKRCAKYTHASIRCLSEHSLSGLTATDHIK